MGSSSARYIILPPCFTSLHFYATQVSTRNVSISTSSGCIPASGLHSGLTPFAVRLFRRKGRVARWPVILICWNGLHKQHNIPKFAKVTNLSRPNRQRVYKIQPTTNSETTVTIIEKETRMLKNQPFEKVVESIVGAGVNWVSLVTAKSSKAKAAEGLKLNRRIMVDVYRAEDKCKTTGKWSQGLLKR